MKKRDRGGKFLRKGKKGASTVVLLRAFGIAMAAFVIVMMIQYWRDVKDSTFLEKNYIARDVAMLISTAYASPGELAYCYYEVGNPNYRFDYEIGNARVVVRDAGKKESATYFYVEDKKKPMPRLTEKYDKDKPLALLMVVKDSAGLRVVGKKRGEDAQPCKQ